MTMDKSLKDKAIKIKGKDYIQVKDRILFLSDEYDGKYSIETEYQYFQERKMWVVKATLTLNDKKYTGLAQELESDDYKQVNHTSALENAETSAVGRACAMAGIGVLDSIASIDEINKAKNRTAIRSDEVVINYPIPKISATCTKCGEIGDAEELPKTTAYGAKYKMTCSSGHINWLKPGEVKKEYDKDADKPFQPDF